MCPLAQTNVHMTQKMHIFDVNLSVCRGRVWG